MEKASLAIGDGGVGDKPSQLPAGSIRSTRGAQKQPRDGVNQPVDFEKWPMGRMNWVVVLCIKGSLVTSPKIA